MILSGRLPPSSATRWRRTPTITSSSVIPVAARKRAAGCRSADTPCNLPASRAARAADSPPSGTPDADRRNCLPCSAHARPCKTAQSLLRIRFHWALSNAPARSPGERATARVTRQRVPEGLASRGAIQTLVARPWHVVRRCLPNAACRPERGSPPRDELIAKGSFAVSFRGHSMPSLSVTGSSTEYTRNLV